MKKRIAFPIVYISFACTLLFAQNIQWASKVDNSTSSYATNRYLSDEILGEPNCLPQGGDIAASWAPSEIKSKGDQSIKVSFEKVLFAKRILIIENFNPGSISKVFAYDAKNKEKLIKTYNPERLSKSNRILSIVLTDSMAIKSIKLVVDPSIDTSKNCIDAIGISLDTVTFKPSINLPFDFVANKKPTKLPPIINTTTNELGPLVLADGKTIFFSRATYSSNLEDDKEEMWCSEKDAKGKWKAPFKLPKPINNGPYNFVSSITPDGNTVLLGNCFNEEGSVIEGCCSFSNRNTEGWGSPENLDFKNYYNNSNKVNHTLSNSGRILIISAEREDSKGERDLYVSFLQETGKWTDPENLGTPVSTATDDYAPFLASDDRTLYFSTSGHSSYGKSDIFVSHRIGDDWKTWSKPENLGPEINTKEDDAYLSITASGEDAYYCTSTNKNMDIYLTKLSKSQRPRPVVLVKGVVLDQKTNKPLESNVYYEDLATGKIVGEAHSRSKTGEYQVALPAGVNYGYRAEVKGSFSVSENLDLSKLTSYQEINQNLFVVPAEVGQKVRLNNLFFEYKMSKLKRESYPELKRLTTYLMANKKVEIEIQGHTDSVGTADYNLKLSEDRTKSVLDYLVQKGIEGNRLITKGFGETMPMSSNGTNKGRALNRRVEFVIMKK